MKKIFLVLVFAFSLFAGESEDIVPIIKHKTEIENGIGISKFIINSEQMGLNQYDRSRNGEFGKYSSNYVSNISATIDNISIFDAALSPYVYSQSYISFKFKDFTASDDITFNVIDNHGKRSQQSFKIIKKSTSKTKNIFSKQNAVSPVVINPKAWNATTVDSAIEAIYGSSDVNILKTYFNDNNIIYPPTTYWGDGNCLAKNCIIDTFYPLRVSIKSEIDLQSIAIFSTSTPRPLLAFLQILNNGVSNITIPFKLEKPGKLFFIGKGKDGKLYRSESSNIEIILADGPEHGSKIYLNIKQ